MLNYSISYYSFFVRISSFKWGFFLHYDIRLWDVKCNVFIIKYWYFFFFFKGSNKHNRIEKRLTSSVSCIRMAYQTRNLLLTALIFTTTQHHYTMPLHNATTQHHHTTPLHNTTTQRHYTTPLHNATTPLHNATTQLHNATTQHQRFWSLHSKRGHILWHHMIPSVHS